MLYGIGSFCARHRLLVLLAWVVIIVGVGLTVSRVGALTSNDLSLPGTDSQRATDLLAERFPPQQNGANPIVFHVEQGTLDAGARKQAIATAAKKLAAIDFVHSAPSPFSTAGAAQLATDRTTAFIPVLLKIGNADLSVADSQRVLDTARAATAGQGIEVAAGGAIGGQLSTPDTESSELVGILVAMVILALTFGSLIAMGLPIISAVVGLMVGLMVVGLLGHLVSIPDIAPTLATMIGLGVGIDYALFLVRRHRQQLDEGMEVNESIAVAVGTSGTAIVFAGTTVVIALLCLAVARIPLVTALGYAAAIAVLTAVIASVTLLPAILALLGHRIKALPIRRRRPPAPGAERGGLWAAWGRLVTARPLLVLAVVLPVLIVLALPVFALNLGQEDIGATPTSTTERQAFDDLSADFGPGYNGPLLIAVELGTPATVDPTVSAQEQQLTDLQNTLQQEQAEGQRQSAQLQKQAAALTAQQAQLQAQAASLQNQANTLQNQAAELRRRKAAIDAQAAQLRAQIAAIEARFRQILARADGPLARLRAAEAQRQNAERELSQVIARIDRLRQRADAAAHPEARRAILAAIAASRADGDRIRARPPPASVRRNCAPRRPPCAPRPNGKPPFRASCAPRPTDWPERPRLWRATPTPWPARRRPWRPPSASWKPREPRCNNRRRPSHSNRRSWKPCRPPRKNSSSRRWR
ncbi:MAG TPA: MMPL family transporter [Miltoncostaeaceae bacterium]|nr:MMPL family transporter [Miltoncostaeaceae bacterium]